MVSEGWEGAGGVGGREGEGEAARGKMAEVGEERVRTGEQAEETEEARGAQMGG